MAGKDRRVYELTHRCRCGGEASQSFSELASGNRLRWWEAWHCPSCGPISEVDGVDRLPDELREHVFRAEGSYRVDVYPRAKLALMALLRAELEMTLADARVAFDPLPHGFRTQHEQGEMHPAEKE